MSFFEVEFPRTISYKSAGGPGFNTTVNKGFSGFEQRNKNWAASRGQWSVSLMTPSAFTNNRAQFLNLLNAFFLNVNGIGDAFRLWDPWDNAAANAFLGTGDGVTNTFQLVKQYVAGGRTYTRTISKPITPDATDYQGTTLPQTVVVYRAGVVDPTSRWSVDGTTGLVTFKQSVGHLNLSNPVFVGSPTFTVTFNWTLTSGTLPVVGQRIVVAGMAHAGNNGTFYITAVTGGPTSGTLTVIDTGGSTQPTDSGTGVTDWTPANGAQLNADFQFHFPVRFDTDQMQITVEESDVLDGQPIGSWSSIALQEVRILPGTSQG